MALATYLDLQTAVANHLNRSDLSARIPEFIAIAQARFNREIRHPRMLTRDDLATVDAQYENTPSGWLETARYTLLSTPVVSLEYLTPEEITEKREQLRDSGKPRYFSVVGDEFEFLPTPGDTYAAHHLYYTAIDLTTTSWLLTDHPDICLHGALVAAEPYIMNHERLPVWKSQLDEELRSLRKSGDRRAVSATPIARTRAGGFE